MTEREDQLRAGTGLDGQLDGQLRSEPGRQHGRRGA
jgi:hypothetical protein